MNILAAGSRDDRAQFLKRLLNILPREELNDAKSIVRRTRRRELKKSGVVPQPVSVPQSVSVPQPVTVPQPTPLPDSVVAAETAVVEDGWWMKWSKVGKCMAMDVEKVSVPMDPSQCTVVKFWKNGLLNVTFKPKVPGKKIKYKLVAAIVAVCDYDGQHIINNELIHHDQFTFKVDAYTFKVNGIRHDSLVNGAPLQLVKSKVEKLLEENLFVTIRGENDFDSLDKLKWGDYDTFDLNSHWYRVTETDKHQNIGLNDIYKEYFNQDLQRGQHSAFADAKGTMRIFRFVYPKEKKYEKESKVNSFPYTF